MSIKRFVPSIVFSIITVVTLVLLDLLVFIPTNGLNPYGCFYKEVTNTLDLVVVGNSTLSCGYVPMEMWNEYKITSYDINERPMHVKLMPIIVDEIARTQTPQVVYIDLHSIEDQMKVDEKKFIQNYVDAMPSGDAKRTICEEYTYLKYDSRPFGLFPYHNNYRSDAKREALFKGPANLFMKGYRPVYKVTNVEIKDIDKERVEDISKEANEFLSTLISTCKKYDSIKFIFGKMPRFHSTESDVMNSYQMRYVKNILLESGFDFYDFCDYVSDIGLDHSVDMYDNEHLNHSGAKKFTKFFGDFLIEKNYININKHSDEIVNSYNECYLKYKNEVSENE